MHRNTLTGAQHALESRMLYLLFAFTLLFKWVFQWCHFEKSKSDGCKIFRGKPLFQQRVCNYMHLVIYKHVHVLLEKVVL